MKILIIADNIECFNIYKDTTYIMLQQLEKNSHNIFISCIQDLYLDNVGLKAKCQKFTFNTQNKQKSIPIWYNLFNTEILEIEHFDVIFMRKDPPYNMEYIYAAHLLEMAAHKGVKVINNPRTLRDFPEKLAIFNYPQYITNTCVTTQKSVIEEFIKIHGACILKPLDFMGGYGILYIDEKATNLASILDLFAAGNNNQARTLMVQKYIPEITKGDKRVLIIGNTIIPYSLTRLLKEGGDSIRSNLVVSGNYSINNLSEKDMEIALAVQKNMKITGVLFAGIDIIGNYLTEVNITSPTGFQEITKSGLLDVGEIWYGEFINYIKNYENHR